MIKVDTDTPRIVHVVGKSVICGLNSDNIAMQQTLYAYTFLVILSHLTPADQLN